MSQLRDLNRRAKAADRAAERHAARGEHRLAAQCYLEAARLHRERAVIYGHRAGVTLVITGVFLGIALTCYLLAALVA